MADPKQERDEIAIEDGIVVASEEREGKLVITVEIDRDAVIQSALPLLLEKAKKASAPPPPTKKPRKPRKKKGEHEPDKNQNTFPFGANAEKKPETEAAKT